MRLNNALTEARFAQKVLTPKRVQNILLNRRSFRKFSKTGNSYHPGLPVSISIEPTTSCNLRCPHCPSGLRSFTRPTGMLDPELNRHILRELSETLSYITYYFQGEPLLHPDFSGLISEAARMNIYTATSTNAHHLSDLVCEKLIESGLNKLIISVDGSRQESYARYRIGGSLEKVLQGTSSILGMRRKLKSIHPLVIWQFIVFRHNEGELEEIKRMASLLGVDEVQIKTAQLYEPEKNAQLLPLNGKYNRYDISDGKPAFLPKSMNTCKRMWQGAVITWDGNVVPCCFDKDAQYEMGNVSHESFRNIWNNNLYRTFRDTLYTGRQNLDICMNCSEGVKVFR